MSERGPTSKVTVEDLIQLKRTERPPPEFWAKFEGELREKQLVALLEKKPRWRDLARLIIQRKSIPAGAAAILAVTFVAMRLSSGTPTGEPAPAASPQSSGGQVIRSAREVAIEVPAPGSSTGIASEPAVAISANAVADTAMEAELRPAIPEDLPPDLDNIVPWSPMPNPPSARSIAANLEHIEEAQPALLSNLLGSRLSGGVRPAASAEHPIMELASVSLKNSPANNRLLAGYTDRQFIPEPTVPELVRERAARRLADDLSDQIRRLDLRGNSVTLKL